MIAYLEPAQFLGTLIMGLGLGIMLTRTYDAVRHQLRMRRIRRNVVAFAEAYDPATMASAEMMQHRALGYHPRDERCGRIACTPVFDAAFPTQTSGPETAPANRDPQEPAPVPRTGVAVPLRVQSGDNREDVAPPVRSSLTHGTARDFDWHVDFTGLERRPS